MEKFNLLLIFIIALHNFQILNAQELLKEDVKEELTELLENVEVSTTNDFVMDHKKFEFSFYDDYETLIAETENPKSSIFIDSLLIKLDKNHRFSNKEKIGLIIGATSLKGYQDPRLEIMYSEIDSMLRQLDKAENNEQPVSLNRVIELSDSCLSIFPLSIEGIIGNYYGYGKLGDIKNKQKNFAKGEIIFNSILKTGTLSSKEKPFVGLGKACIHWYCMGFANAGYKKINEFIDENENTIMAYKNILGEVDYYLVPKK